LGNGNYSGGQPKIQQWSMGSTADVKAKYINEQSVNTAKGNLK